MDNLPKAIPFTPTVAAFHMEDLWWFYGSVVNGACRAVFYARELEEKYNRVFGCVVVPHKFVDAHPPILLKPEPKDWGEGDVLGAAGCVYELPPPAGLAVSVPDIDKASTIVETYRDFAAGFAKKKKKLVGDGKPDPNTDAGAKAIFDYLLSAIFDEAANAQHTFPGKVVSL